MYTLYLREGDGFEVMKECRSSSTANVGLMQLLAPNPPLHRLEDDMGTERVDAIQLKDSCQRVEYLTRIDHRRMLDLRASARALSNSICLARSRSPGSALLKSATVEER